MMLCPDPAHATSPRHALYDRGETDFRVCPACGLAFREKFPDARELDAIYADAYSAQAIESDATNQESGDYATGIYARFIATRLVKPGDTVLDFGAATGALVRQLRERRIDVEGFEFSASAREHARQHHGLDLMGQLDALPAQRYELISMIEVIEHLTDLWGTLHALRRALKPGGTLFVTTPSRTGWRARLEGGNWREARKKFHLFLFDEPSLKHHLAGTGFAPVDRIRYNPVLRPGIKADLFTRATQLAGLGGTLCVIARRPG